MIVVWSLLGYATFCCIALAKWRAAELILAVWIGFGLAMTMGHGF